MLTDLLRMLAPIVSRDDVIVSIVVALIIWTSWSGWSLLRATALIQKSCAQAIPLLRPSEGALAFGNRYEQASMDLDKVAVIGPSWTRFKGTLIIPLANGRPVSATSPAVEWFNLGEMLRLAGADARYHAALPGLLVGAGLLFTFLGLAAALSAAGEVVAEGVDQARRNAALRDLLGAASVKFITSLAGLGLSIGYALFRKWRLRAAEASIAGLLAALDDCMPLKTTATLQAEANVVLEKQYTDVQRIGADFFTNLGSTLEHGLDTSLHQHIAPLAQAIDKLSDKLANHTEDAMQSMLQAFLARLEGAVGDSMRATTTTLDALGGRLDGLQGAMDAAARRMGQAAEEMAAGMGRGAESALGGITEQMSALVRTLREAAEEAGRSNRAAGDDLARQMAATASSLTAAVEGFQRRLEDGAADGIGRLSGPIEALLAQLRDLATSQREAGNTATAALSATIARSADALEATAAKVAEVLGGGAADASARLIAATEAMRDDLRGVLAQFSATLGDSGALLTQGATAGGDALRLAAGAMGEDIAAAAVRLREAADAAGTALREGGREARAGLDEASRTLIAGSTGLSDRLAGLATISAGLADQLRAFDQAARAAATPLAAGAADLRVAGEAAREANVGMRDVARAMAAALDGLATASTGMAVTQRGTDQLMGQLGQTADRFKGLDEELARTLGGLQRSLGEYHNYISRFVVDMDAGLAKSVSGINALALGLTDSVEKLTERVEELVSVGDIRAKAGALR